MCCGDIFIGTSTPAKSAPSKPAIAVAAAAIMSTPPAPEKKVVLTMSEETASFLAWLTIKGVTWAQSDANKNAEIINYALSSAGIDSYWFDVARKDYHGRPVASRTHYATFAAGQSASAEVITGEQAAPVMEGVTLTLDIETARELRAVASDLDGPGLNEIFTALQYDVGLDRDDDIRVGDSRSVEGSRAVPNRF